MEKFQEMLKDPSQSFELHESIKDSTGREKFMRVNRDEVATRTGIQAIATQVANEIIDHTF